MKLRPAIAALLAAAGLAPALPAQPTSPAPARPGPAPAVLQPVAAPYWGDALFRVYQGRHFEALTTLMASQHFGRLGPHGDEAEATRGGLLLAFGLHDPAEASFTALAERGTRPELRGQAWVQLARLRGQRGLLPQAEAALARVQGRLPDELEDERRLLAARLRLAAGDLDGAAAQLHGLAQAGGSTAERAAVSDAWRYARHNLGVALLRGGQVQAGQAWLQGLAAEPAQTEEQRSLRDRARLALGFGALRRGEPGQARAQLEGVRLVGPSSNAALLGFGWAAIALDAPRDALVPWQELLRREPGDPAVLEARLAVPHALARLQAEGQAHDGYRQALAAFALQARALDESAAGVASGAVVEALLAHNPGQAMGWRWQAGELPPLAHPAHWLPLLSTHRFQEALKDQRDLRFLGAHLRRWAGDLDSFGDMLAARRQAFAQRLPTVQAAAQRQALQGLGAARAELARRLEQAEHGEDDGLGLANARERALRQRLQRVQAALAALPPAMADPARERARLAAGALSWQLAREHDARRWAARKQLRDIDAELEAAARRDAALAQAQRDEPARFDRFEARLAELAGRVAALQPRVAALQGEQQLVLQAMAHDALATQQARLAEHAAQARFALAQLQDRALIARQDDANPPAAAR